MARELIGEKRNEFRADETPLALFPMYETPMKLH
jgi:hypothetical protein